MCTPQPRRLSLRTKIALAMATVASLVVTAILATHFHFRRAQLLYEFQAFVRGVAGTAALALSGDDLVAVREMEDASSPAFERARRVLDQTRTINRLAENEAYILRPVRTEPVLETEFVVMLQEKTFIGDRYTVPEANCAHFLEAWRTRLPTHSGRYDDEHGSWISGYAPILNHAGEPTAMLEVDAEISRFAARQREELLLALAIGAAAFCIAMIP